MTTAVKAQLAIATLMFAASPWVINAAPHEATMGLVYKIYFYHMPSAWMFMVAAIVAGVASARFLFTKRAASDADRFVKRKRPLATPETMAASMNIHAEGMW